jgi:hypothetical protein
MNDHYDRQIRDSPDCPHALFRSYISVWDGEAERVIKDLDCKLEWNSMTLAILAVFSRIPFIAHHRYAKHIMYVQ